MLHFLFKYGTVTRTRRLPLFHLEFPLDFNGFAICATDSPRFRPHTILGAVSVFKFFLVKLYKFEMRCFCFRSKTEFEATSTPEQLFHRSNNDTCRPQMLSYWFSKHLVQHGRFRIGKRSTGACRAHPKFLTIPTPQLPLFWCYSRNKSYDVVCCFAIFYKNL